jgi:hypothetical protein
VLFVSDPSQYPPHLTESGEWLDVAPPVFTFATRQAKRNLKKEVGQTFRVRQIIVIIVERL